jgi:hypothetical protein
MNSYDPDDAHIPTLAQEAELEREYQAWRADVAALNGWLEVIEEATEILKEDNDNAGR